MMDPPPPAYLTVAEFAALHGVHRQSVFQWIWSGRLAAERVGRAWRIPRDAQRPPAEFTARAQAGGQALVAQRGREYMAQLGRRGGAAVSQDRAHMVAIARRGGRIRQDVRPHHPAEQVRASPLLDPSPEVATRLAAAAGVVGVLPHLRILAALLHEEQTVRQLQQATGSSQPNTSKHLQTLRNGGVVTYRPLGAQRLYRLSDADPVARACRALLLVLEQHLTGQEA